MDSKSIPPFTVVSGATVHDILTDWQGKLIEFVRNSRPRHGIDGLKCISGAAASAAVAVRR
jgi:hypothetical protein